jgi:hypothetical protein
MSAPPSSPCKGPEHLATWPRPVARLQRRLRRLERKAAALEGLPAAALRQRASQVARELEIAKAEVLRAEAEL